MYHGKHSFCSFRPNGKHVQLEGRIMTSKASKYPKRLAEALTPILVRSRKTGWALDGFSSSGIIAKFYLKLDSQSRVFDIVRSSEEEMLTMFFCKWLHSNADTDAYEAQC